MRDSSSAREFGAEAPRRGKRYHAGRFDGRPLRSRPMPTPLPVDAALGDLLAALGERANAVLEAPPGAGKTTRVPPALLAAGLAGEGTIVVLEPRRVAARAAARRIAAERGWTVGREVGWQIRFERNFTRETRILFLTEGVLVQRLQSDPFLEGI